MRDWTAGRRVGVVLAATATCQAIQMAFLPREGVGPGWGFFWAQLAFILAIQAGIALLGAAWRDARPWAAAAFVVPVALSLVTGRFLHSVPETWTQAGAAALVLLAVVAAMRGYWPEAPWASAALGCVASAEILRFRADVFVGSTTVASGYLRPAAVLLGTAAVVCILHRSKARSLDARTMWASGALALAVAAALLVPEPWKATLAAGARSHGRDAPPIVLIVLDTVRADRLRSYGGARDVMPHLDAFGARHCLRAARSIAMHPSSLETHATFLTGLVPPDHGAHRPFLSEGADNPRYAHPLADAYLTLPERLEAAGYWSVGLSGNSGPLSPEFGLDQGFAVYRARAEDMRRRSAWHAPLEWLRPHTTARLARALPASWGPFLNTMPYRDARVITDEALTVLDAAGDRSLFLFLNYFDAHAPQGPPVPFLDAFDGREPDSDLNGSHASTRRFYEAGVELTTRERAHLLALYDGELAYIDSELGRLFESLERHPRWAEMLVIVTADHGESLGEHGLIGHGHSLYEEQLSVPFFAKPGRVPTPIAAPGVLHDATVQSSDVFPLVLRQAGLPEPAGADAGLWGAGRTATRAWSYCARDHSRFNRARFERELRSVEVGPLKLIESSRGSVELYDLATDAHEIHDLSAERPDTVAELKDLLGPWGEPPGAAGQGALSDDAKERLRALGYVQ